MKRPLWIAAFVFSVFVAGFLLVAHEVRANGSLVRFDEEFGRSFVEGRRDTAALRALFVALTQLASVEVLFVLVPLGACLFWRRGDRTAAIVFLICGIGAGLLNSSTKKHYGRPRPEFKDERVRESNASFPSGHSSGSMAVFGFLIYREARTKRSTRTRLLIQGTLAVLIAATGFSRIYLGAHYFSDVLAGYLLGGAWLTLCILAATVAESRFPGRQL